MALSTARREQKRIALQSSGGRRFHDRLSASAILDGRSRVMLGLRLPELHVARPLSTRLEDLEMIRIDVTNDVHAKDGVTATQRQERRWRDERAEKNEERSTAV
jgi:hypothetical protein